MASFVNFDSHYLLTIQRKMVGWHLLNSEKAEVSMLVYFGFEPEATGWKTDLNPLGCESLYF